MKIFDYIFFSFIEFDNNGNISKIQATEYDMMHKATALKQIAEKENIQLKDTVFIGDHHNDVEIAKIAGLSIAFCPNDEELRKVADIIIEKRDLREILKYIED